MKLEPFDNTHTIQLKDWFSEPIDQNEFISFYSDPSTWLGLVDNKRRYALAFMSDDILIGFADVELEEHRSANIAFGVNPSSRAKGIGGQLLKLIELFVSERQVKVIHAGVDNRNTACIALLIKFGYLAKSKNVEVSEYFKTLD